MNFLFYLKKKTQNLYSVEKKMDNVEFVVDPLREFVKDNIQIVKRCREPDHKSNKKKIQ